MNHSHTWWRCEVEPKRYKLELLSDDGVPGVPMVEAIVEFFIGVKTGEVEKGESRALRDADVYASPKTQADMFMPLRSTRKVRVDGGIQGPAIRTGPL
eukprot:6677340-Prymnesium_polylepis.1